MSYLVHILSNINFQELKRYVFIVFLKQFVVIAHLSSFGKLFHRIAAPGSIRRLPYRTDMELLMWCWQISKDDLDGTSLVSQICNSELHS